MGLTIKRLFDIAASAGGLLVLSPLFVYLYFRIRSSIGSPVFFKQVRIGKHERPFTLVKFRSMRPGSGSDAERMTGFGEWLRASSLDELPELWNILRGDMSLIGPRPLLPEYLPYYTERERTRHHMRPGITGLAQISGRNALSWNERLELDTRYVENWSLREDVRIFMDTFRTVKNKEGISAEGHATMERLDDYRKGNSHAAQ